MNDRFECWVFVPGTDRRFAVSNLGRFMKVARKRRKASAMAMEAILETVPVVSDYKTRTLGWYAYYDNQNHFLARDGLMALFPKELVDVDTSQDKAALAKRNDTFREVLR